MQAERENHGWCPDGHYYNLELEECPSCLITRAQEEEIDTIRNAANVIERLLTTTGAEYVRARREAGRLLPILRGQAVWSR